MADVDPMTVDLEELDDDQFMTVWTALSDEATAVRERLVEFNQEHRRRARKEQLARVGAMTPEDLALLQEIAAEGIASQEAVGEPGSEA